MRDKKPIKRPSTDRGFNRNSDLDRKIVLTIVIATLVAIIVLVLLLLLLSSMM